MKGHRSILLYVVVFTLAVALPSLVTFAFLWVFLSYLLIVKEIWKDQVHPNDLDRVMKLYQESLIYVRITLYTLTGLMTKWIWCDVPPEVRVAYVMTIPFVITVLLLSKRWHRSIKPLVNRYRFRLRTQRHLFD